MEYKTLLLLFILLQLFITICIRYFEQSWFSPSSLFALIWSFIIGFSILSAPDYYFSIRALSLLIFLIVTFFVGGKLIDFIPLSTQEKIRGRNRIDNWSIRISFVLKVGVTAGLLALLSLLNESGLKLNDLTNLNKISEASFILSQGRYSGIRLSPLTMAFLTISYFTSFFAGIQLAFNANIRQKIQVFLIIMPILIFTIFYTARSTLLFMLVIIGGSYFAFRPLYLKNQPILFNRKNVVYGLLGLVGIFSIFLFSQAARMGLNVFSLRQLTFLSEYLKVWFSGNVSGFCSWFDVSYNPCQSNSGFHTFAGMSEWFGLGQRKLGIYDTAIDVNHKMAFSNIYTLFRFIIDDFGLIGSFVFFLLFGFASKFFYVNSIKGNWTSAALLSGIFTMLLFSFTCSVFAYNSILISWIIFVLIVAFFKIKVDA
jgi:oligosaccharide repeat unit polymerase